MKQKDDQQYKDIINWKPMERNRGRLQTRWADDKTESARPRWRNVASYKQGIVEKN